MEKFSATAVYSLAGSFEKIRSACNFHERAGLLHFSGEAKPGNMHSIELLGARTIREMSDDWKKSFSLLLKSVEFNGSKIGLNLAVQAANNYKKSMESGMLNSYSDAEKAVDCLDTIIELQLSENLFMFIPQERASYFAKPELFGEKVARKFPNCQYDIEEAGNCYTAGRGTAVAFHLMRVMEATLQSFGVSMGITFTDIKEWHNILDEVNKEIKKMPAKDARTIALSQAAGNLYNVKVAWRNPTMHPKSTYTIDEAKDLLLSVKAFTSDLAEVI
jgi:hypothetical protein